MKAHLQVQSQATYKFHVPHAVPFALKEALERELACLQQLGILKKVDHSEWAASIIVVPTRRLLSKSVWELLSNYKLCIGC